MSVKLLNALMRHASPPCDKYACPNRGQCSSQLLACAAFRHYAISGRSDPPRTVYPDKRVTKHDRPYLGDEIVATREIFDSLEHDTDCTQESREEKIQEAMAGGMASKTNLERAWGQA